MNNPHKTSNKCHAELVEARTPSLTNRVLALFLTLTVLLPSITPYNNLWANNNGPNAPEAASFEPVDATDMVNLLTGDFSYVLPLMNVPSPEGGYPIALAYHGGVAMDLESSWVGLGWNLNPGAINRSVNGYPDDYSNTTVTDYFYDEGQTISISYASFFYTNGAISIGVGASWGSHQSTSGSVNVGFGLPGLSVNVGTSGASIGTGIKVGGLSIGASINSDGKVVGNVGYGIDTNGGGFSIGASTDGTYGFSFTQDAKNGRSYSLGVDLSSDGAGLTVGVSQEFESTGKTGSHSIGIGPDNFSNTTYTQGDYTTNRSSNNIGIFIPTPIGIFGFSFGKTKIKIYGAKQTDQLITGPLNFGNTINSDKYYTVTCSRPGKGPGYGRSATFTFKTYKEAEEFSSSYDGCGEPELVITGEAFMDTYEVPITDSELANSYDITLNNPVFPSYDNYNVQAQGLSGNMHANLIDNGRLFGLSKEIVDDDGNIMKVNYEYDGLFNETGELDSDLDFKQKPQFYFDNEISSYLAAPKANFLNLNDALSSDSIQDIFDNYNFEEPQTNRFKKANHIEYLTNEELLKGNGVDQGFLKPNSEYDRTLYPINGIGAYKITAPDGKTYHYSLPVYNHETITRSYGAGISSFNHNQECEAYIEKRQLEAYATHWLLTAVTGPDFIDNGDHVAGEGDLGYWVNFDYGLWSDAYVWSPHSGEEYVQNSDIKNVKTWMKGRKQLYYLDKISTRTHTAVFIKSEDESNPSLRWQYNSVAHDGTRQYCSDYNENERFTIPEHSRLKLDRILLVKNEDFNLPKQIYNTTPESVNVHFNDSDKPLHDANYEIDQNVYDVNDNWEALKSFVLKEVVLDQDYRLSNNQLTLNSVDFKGKQAVSALPPYHFEYIEDRQYSYDKEDANDWGYYKNDPKLWSLENIVTPQGANIEIDYEQHIFRSAMDHDFIFKNNGIGVDRINNKVNITINSVTNLKNGDVIKLIVGKITRYPDEGDCKYDHDKAKTYCDFQTFNYSNEIIVEEIISKDASQTIFTAKLLEGNVEDYLIERTSVNIGDYVDYEFTDEELADIVSKDFNWSTITFNSQISDNIYEGNAGPRVSSITTTNGIESYTSQYNYGENEDGIGWVSYIPYAPFVDEEAPYRAELPSPRPVYEYVTLSSIDTNGKVTGKTTYRFNVLKNKEEDHIKYGDLYELNSTGDLEAGSGNKTVKINAYAIQDNLNTIGQLLSVSSYNGNNQLLSKLTNDYYHKGELPDNLGVTQESYQSYKKIIENEGENDASERWLVNSSTRVKHPNVLKSSTELKNGVSYTTTFSDFDPVSGQAKQTHSKSSLGVELKTLSEPAFYHYPEMGSKAVDVNNKNMLSQGAQTLSYFKDSNSVDWELYGAEVDTWKDWGSNVWRKHQNYAWKSDINENGSYQNFTPFNYNSESQAEGWQRLSEVTRYSDYSRALETMDINGNKASNKLGDHDSKVMAVCNAPYDAMSYSNFEHSTDYLDAFDAENLDKEGSIKLYGSTIVSTKAHTGKYSLKTPSSNGVAFSDVIKVPGKYKASAWVHKDNYSNTVLYITEGFKTIDYNKGQVVEAGDWVQLNFNFELTEESFVGLQNTSGIAYYDDFRVHPVDSGMTSYVYNEWDELTCILGANNMAVKYEYDGAGKLIRTYKEVAINSSTNGGFKLINETNYNYKNQ